MEAYNKVFNNWITYHQCAFSLNKKGINLHLSTLLLNFFNKKQIDLIQDHPKINEKKKGFTWIIIFLDQLDFYICWIKGSFPFITSQPITFEFHTLNFIPFIYFFINYNYFHSYDSSMVITHSSIKIISYDWVNFVHYVHFIYFDNFNFFGLHSSFFFHIHQWFINWNLT